MRSVFADRFPEACSYEIDIVCIALHNDEDDGVDFSIQIKETD